MLRNALLAPALIALVMGTAQARGDAITDVITDQLDAFAARDAPRAFTFASPMIKGMFGTPERFGEMVQNGYPMIWNPEDPTFGPRREEGARIYQQLLLDDPSGRVRIMEYEMIQMQDGWKINGVRELQMPDVAA